MASRTAIKEWYINNPVGKSVTIIRPTVIFGEETEETFKSIKTNVLENSL